MNVNSKTFSIISRIALLIVLCSAAGFLLLKASSSPTIAGTQERVFENAIPLNAPIKIKIKKEKEQSFKDLKNDKWVREFELEVTNTSDKPIYFIYLNLVTDVKLSGGPLMFALVYGRAELGNIINKAGPSDTPIKPGDTYVFRVHPGQIPAWEEAVMDKSHPEATHIKAKVEVVSFGDGTGYFVNKPYPRADQRQS